MLCKSDFLSHSIIITQFLVKLCCFVLDCLKSVRDNKTKTNNFISYCFLLSYTRFVFIICVTYSYPSFSNNNQFSPNFTCSTIYKANHSTKCYLYVVTCMWGDKNKYVLCTRYIACTTVLGNPFVYFFF